MPLKWTVETSRATPAQFEAYQGETLALEAALQSYGKPLEASGIAALYWQTNGMGSAYWETTAAVNSNRLSAVWTPEMDVGAKSYNCFIGVPGTVYHAAFQLRLRPSPGADPNTLPLPVPVIDFAKVRVLNPPWEGGGGSGVNTNAVRDIAREEIIPATNRLYKTLSDAKDGAARPLPPYLHALDFDDSYPDAADEYYRSRGDGKVDGGCSSVRSGNFLSRNFDYPFDDRAEFVVKMSAGPDRFASVGVAQVGTNLTESLVTSGKPSRWYKSLPGATVDGINEHGVVAEINVVDGAPEWHTTGDLHPLAAVRWALDHATNAQHAATYLAANIRFPEGWQQNFHYMIADETSTYIVENGAAHLIQGPTGVPPVAAMTNFRLYPTPSSGEGQERYAALMSGANITSQWWTLTYTPDGYRASDLPGITGSALTQLFDYWASKPREAHRGEIFPSSLFPIPYSLSWWQTVHTSVYDITNRVLRIAVQETDDWYTFALAKNGTDEAKVREIAEAVVAPVAARTGADITTGGDYTPFYSTDPENPLAYNVESLDYAIMEVEGKLDDFETEVDENFARKDESVASHDGIADDLTVNGLTSTSDSTFEGNVSVGPNSLYLDGTLIEEIFNTYTKSHTFENHRDNSSIHVTAAEKSSWTSSISSLSSSVSNLSSSVSGLESSKLDKSGGSMTGPLTIGSITHTGEGFESFGNEYYFPSSHGGTLALLSDIPPPYTPSATDPTFSNAVLSVATGISTNDWAVIASVADWASVIPGGVPTGAGTLGAVLAALAAAVLALKKKTSLLKSDGTAEDDFATDLMEKPVAISAVQNIVNVMFDNGDTTAYPRTTGEG